MPPKKRNAIFQKLSAGVEKPTITPAEAIHLGLGKNHDQAYVALKYFDPEYQCFSHWTKQELNAFSTFVQKINQQNWQQIIASGGKPGTKKGLGYTQHQNRNSLPNSPVLKRISEDINFIELRITQKARVHGFRVKSAFFIVWLDRNHEIYKQ